MNKKYSPEDTIVEPRGLYHDTIALTAEIEALRERLESTETRLKLVTGLLKAAFEHYDKIWHLLSDDDRETIERWRGASEK